MPAPVEEFIDLGDGARLWAVTEGTGSPVVWCHGGPGGIDNLGAVTAMIADVARVHRFEQRGCGHSSGGPPFTMDQAVADLDALRRHWGHPRWVVAGHSFGAALALAYALAHPDRAEAVIYASCVVRLKGQPDWYEAYRQARLDRLPGPRRTRFLELSRLREQGSIPSSLATERRSLAVGTEFAHPAMAERMKTALLAEFAAVNEEVNRELGADFSRYFRHGVDPAPPGHPRDTCPADPRYGRPATHGGSRSPHRPAAPPTARAPGRRRPLSVLESPDDLRAILREFLGSLAS